MVAHMTRSSSPRRQPIDHAPSTVHGSGHAGGAQPDARPADTGAAFQAEVAALEALDDAAFADVVPAIRPPIVCRVVARGCLEP